RLNRRRQSLFAPVVHAIGKNNHRLPPLLLAHQLIRRQKDRVIQSRPAAPRMSSASAAPASSTALTPSPAAPASAATVILRRLQRLQRRLQFRPRCREVLQQLHIFVEVNPKRQILVLPQQLIQKAVARASFLIQHPPLTQTRVHQQPHPQRHVALPHKVADRLRPPVLRHRKILFRQIRDDLSMLIPHRSQHANRLHLYRNLRRCPLRRLSHLRRTLRLLPRHRRLLPKHISTRHHQQNKRSHTNSPLHRIIPHFAPNRAVIPQPSASIPNSKFLRTIAIAPSSYKSCSLRIPLSPNGFPPSTPIPAPPIPQWKFPLTIN